MLDTRTLAGRVRDLGTLIDTLDASDPMPAVKAWADLFEEFTARDEVDEVEAVTDAVNLWWGTAEKSARLETVEAIRDLLAEQVIA